MTKAFQKYFAHYAEREVESLSDFPAALCFCYAAVIPAYKESSTFVDQFIESQSSLRACLLVLVINQPSADQEITPQEQLYLNVLEKGELLWSSSTPFEQTGQLKLIKIAQTNSCVLIVDRYRVPIPIDEGVGLARKIGADIASYLYDRKQIVSSFLHSTDADATLPTDYFIATECLLKNDVACCYNFSHSCNDLSIHQANALYEEALRYYVSGLKYANSPYAFFTIGSIIAVRFEAYVAVRGFPRKSAGEDFYLLNKVAKLGQVAWLENSIITLEARTSDRVPFGTGPAVRKILQLQAENKHYCYYNPIVFDYLKILYEELEHIVTHKCQIDVWLNEQPLYLVNALLSIGFRVFVNKQSKANDVQFIKQFHAWFDAFKTLKFIHALRDLGVKDLPLKEALNCNFSRAYKNPL